MYIINNVDYAPIRERGRKQVAINAAIFLVFFLYFMVRILLKDGFAYDPTTREVFMEPFKYFNNYMEMPVALILLILGVVMVLYGIGITWFKKSTKGIWFTGPGVFATVLSLFCIVGYNHTSFYPSFDLQSSLTIENASSSHYTLTAMTYISFLVPVVAAYIFYAWRMIDRKKITIDDVKEDSEHHVY
jgi:cytochrome d ubiquinol oxidase subunit II